MKLLLPFVVIILFWSCGPHKSERAAVKAIAAPAPFITPSGDKVIFLDDYFAAYLKAVRLNYKKRDSILEATVSNPIHDRYFKKNVSATDRFPKALSAITDTTSLDSIISGIETNKVLIETKIIHALTDCRGYLKNDSLTIYIGPSNKYMKKIVGDCGGIYSWCIGNKGIILMIDPQIRGWVGLLPFSIAHQYQHAYSWTKMNLGALLAMDLMDRIVAEGKADWYAHVLYPDVKMPWDTALSDEGLQYQWSRIKAEMRSEDYYQIQGIMFGSDNYPEFTGYSVGFDLVQSALKKNAALTPEQWSNESPALILQMSEYKTQ